LDTKPVIKLVYVFDDDQVDPAKIVREIMNDLVNFTHRWVSFVCSYLINH